jgi:thiamine-phosphate pyrophosphorylase
MRMIDFRLCLVTDDRAREGVREAVAAACGAGVRAVQLRSKSLDARDLYELAMALREDGHSCRLLVNDRVDIAMAARLDGVHCPEHGFPPQTARSLLPQGSLVGASCHSSQAVRRASQAGASFVFFGPVYETPSKAVYGDPLGIDALRGICAASAVPVFAIGGVTPERATECVEAGAAGVAVIRSVLDGHDIASRVRLFADALDGL